MKIDIHTLIIIISITNIIQVIALFLQYKVNKTYKGVGWWLLGFISMAIGYSFLFFRGIILIKMITIILANVLIMSGEIFLYIGIMRFFDKKENRGIIFIILPVFLLSFLYFTYFNDSITARTVIIYGILGMVSFMIFQSIVFNRVSSVTASANFTAAIFLIQGCFFSFRSLETLTVDPVSTLFTPTIMQTASFLFLFVIGILLTFGLIIMLDQRLNAENREDKENLELIFNTSPDAVSITRLTDNHLVKINEIFSKFSGYSKEELIGKSSMEINFWKDPVDRQRIIKELSEKGFCDNMEICLVRKDGIERHGILSARVFTMEGVPHFISVARDITDRKLAENLLEQTHQNYETFFNTIDDFLFVLDEEGKIIYTNATVIHRLGYTMRELYGQPVLMIHPPERRDEAARIVGEMLAGRAEFCPVPIATKSGIQIPVETRVSHGFWDGKPAIFGVTKDVSKVRLSEEKFSKLFHINPSACGLSDLENNKYIEVNEAFYNLLGFEGKEVIGKTAVELGILTREKINAVLLKADSNGKVSNAETELIAKNGGVKHVLLSSENINVQDKKYRFTVAHDITKRKLAEAALRESELKYRSLIENTSDVVFCVNEKGEYQFANNVFASTFGQTPEYFIGKTFWDVYPEAEADYRQAANKKVFETGETQSLEVNVPLPDRALYFLAKANPIKDETGKVILNLTTATDITERKEIEKALHDSEEKFRQLVENSHDIIYTLTSEGIFTFVSPAWTELLGHPINQVQGKSFIPFVHPEDIPACTAWLNKVIETGERQEGIEYRVQHIDGKWCWHTSSAVPLRNDAGTVIGFEGTARDISQRKQTEEELRKREEQIRSINNNMQSGMIYQLLIDKNGSRKFTYLSDSVKILYGITPEEGMADPGLIYRKVHEDDVSRLVEEEEAAIKTVSTFRTELRTITPSGNIRWAYLVSIPKLLDDGSICFDGIEFDITDRKHAEDALRESEEKLSTLFGSMTEMVVLHELVFNESGDAVNYRITDCNNAFSRITGIKREDAVGKLATDLYQTETPPFFTEYSRVALTGKSYEYTTYFEPMDKHFSISAVSPKKNHFATITTDITSIREVQDEIFSKNEELENYLYIASHDLRSPLVNIQGFSRRLQKQADSIKEIISGSSLAPEIKSGIDKIIEEGIPKSLNYIFTSVTKMDTLLNGLLHLSRTGRSLMTIKQVDANKLFNTIIGNYNFQLTELNAGVTISDLPPCYGDENLLNQLFSNIIGNAVKYRDNNRKLHIEITAQVEFRKIVYSIKDNGSGIDQRHLEKIWDIFYKVDSSQADSGEGLGLSIVKRIAEKHNGKVRVESEPGKGSAFFVELQRYEFSE